MMPMKRRFALRAAALGTTAGAVAEAAGLNGGQLSAILSGKTDPRVTTIHRIEDALGVTRGWLVADMTDEDIATQAATIQPPTWLATASQGNDT